MMMMMMTGNFFFISEYDTRKIDCWQSFFFSKFNRRHALVKQGLSRGMGAAHTRRKQRFLPRLIPTPTHPYCQFALSTITGKTGCQQFTWKKVIVNNQCMGYKSKCILCDIYLFVYNKILTPTHQRTRTLSNRCLGEHRPTNKQSTIFVISVLDWN